MEIFPQDYFIIGREMTVVSDLIFYATACNDVLHNNFIIYNA